MESATNKKNRRKQEIQKINRLYENPNIVHAVHYSCESSMDRQGWDSPRITSLAVRNAGSGQITSFSIHLIVEEKRIRPEQIDEKYDELERAMLGAFYNRAYA